MYNKYSQQYCYWCKFYDNADEEMRTIHKYITFRDADILEVGCGTGRFTERLLLDDPSSVIAIDNDIESINIASGNIVGECVKFSLLDANEIENQFVQNQFDFVIFSWSLNYIRNHCHVLNATLRCCKPNGKIVILFPCNSEYSTLIESVKKHEGTAYFSDAFYCSIKLFFTERKLNLFEDEIVTEFIYPTETEALEHNLFHWDAISETLTKDEINGFRNKLLKFRKEDGKIYIEDRVKLLIGG